MKHRNKNVKMEMHEKAEQAAAQAKPPAPTPEQIRRRAQEIFEARGSATGHELDDWLKAEHELKQELAKETS